ncbi:MAG: heme exporter protein CcmD [Proteobacteria bacterium]|nr:heme exporter protein CcmD [Pseudomonadota bacterium]
MSQLTEFLHMGGYGLYVWSSYGLCLIVLLINVILPVRREKQIIKSLKKRQEREACS